MSSIRSVFVNYVPLALLLLSMFVSNGHGAVTVVLAADPSDPEGGANGSDERDDLAEGKKGDENTLQETDDKPPGGIVTAKPEVTVDAVEQVQCEPVLASKADENTLEATNGKSGGGGDGKVKRNGKLAIATGLAGTALIGGLAYRAYKLHSGSNEGTPENNGSSDGGNSHTGGDPNAGTSGKGDVDDQEHSNRKGTFIWIAISLCAVGAVLLIAGLAHWIVKQRRSNLSHKTSEHVAEHETKDDCDEEFELDDGLSDTSDVISESLV